MDAILFFLLMIMSVFALILVPTYIAVYWPHWGGDE